MPIHLHIGTHKTGTTSIQRQLKRNRESLKKLGIWYPSEGELLPGRGHGITHRNIARSLDNRGGPKPYSPDELCTIVRSIAVKSQQYEHTIISSEAFWRIGFAAAPELYSEDELWLRKQSNIAQIRRLFQDVDVRVTAVLRERGAYIQSGYSEFILATIYKHDIKTFIRSYGHGWDYGRQLLAWSSQFPVQAHSYEDLSKSGQLPLDFLRRLCERNLPDETLAPDKKSHANTSDPIDCVAFKLFLNQLPLDYHKRNKLYRKYSKIFKATCTEPSWQSLAAANSWLTGAELAALRQSFITSDQQIRFLYCPKFISIHTDEMAQIQPGNRTLLPLSTADHQQVLSMMLSQKPLKPAWFSPAELKA